MAVPKRKISKTRGRKRRTHWKAKDNLSLEKKDNHYQIGIHIADVSHFFNIRTTINKKEFLFTPV